MNLWYIFFFSNKILYQKLPKNGESMHFLLYLKKKCFILLASVISIKTAKLPNLSSTKTWVIRYLINRSFRPKNWTSKRFHILDSLYLFSLAPSKPIGIILNDNLANNMTKIKYIWKILFIKLTNTLRMKI